MPRRTTFARGGSGKRDVRQLNSILTDYKRFVGVVEDEALRILDEAARMILAATIPLTPKDTGALRASGRAFSQMGPRGPVALVTFGGPENPVTPTKNAPSGIVWYAIMVHEDLERSYKVGGPKYLERGAMDSRQEVDDYIISELRKIKL